MNPWMQSGALNWRATALPLSHHTYPCRIYTICKIWGGSFSSQKLREPTTVHCGVLLILAILSFYISFELILQPFKASTRKEEDDESTDREAGSWLFLCRCAPQGSFVIYVCSMLNLLQCTTDAINKWMKNYKVICWHFIYYEPNKNSSYVIFIFYILFYLFLF